MKNQLVKKTHKKVRRSKVQNTTVDTCKSHQKAVGVLNFVLFLPSVVLEMKGLAPSLALEACMYWHNAI